MVPTLYRSGRHLSEADVQSFAEFLRTTDGGERQCHRLLEAHPTIIGALGFIEFLSEYPLSKRDDRNRLLLDPRHSDRADILAARLTVSMGLGARKFANVIELKGANIRVLDARTHRRSAGLNQAVSQLRDYSGWLTEVHANRESLARFGWDVWKPSKTVVMGSMAEFHHAGQLEHLKQELLDTDGVQLLLIDELLALVEMERRRQSGASEDAQQIEGVIGFNNDNRFFAPLIVASGGLAGFILAHRRIHDSATPYGNIDIRNGVPSGLVHIPKPRVQPLARKLEIPFAEALVGFSKYGQMYKAEKVGIVVADFDADALRHALELRELRNLPLREKARAARISRETAQVQHIYEEQRQRAERFFEGIRAMFPDLPTSTARGIAVHATALGSGRVGTNLSLRLEEAIWLAVAAYAAYRHLGLQSKQEADSCRDRVRTLLRTRGGPDPDQVLRDSLLR